MIPLEKKFCFCTLALGKKYRALALLLAQDIEIYSPNTYFVVFTDCPQQFSKYPHVLAFEHKQHGVKCYHDKRFPIAKALSLFNSCIFMDSDMRILAPVEDLQWLLSPGISARACVNISKKFSQVFLNNKKTEIKTFEVLKKAMYQLNLDAEWENIKFVHEYLFAITKDSGKEIEFLQQWETLANYFELNGIYHGEGIAIGLAACKAGFPVRWSEMSGISFFNNIIEAVRIQKGQSNLDEISKYLEEHKKIIYPKQSIIRRKLDTLRQHIVVFYRFMKLKTAALVQKAGGRRQRAAM